MSAPPVIAIIGSAAERYDRALLRAKDGRLPKDHPVPRPTAAWPPENVALLERYRDWLVSGGMSTATINQLYIPTAGHVLGFHLTSHTQLNLETDLQCALDYVQAKQVSRQWLKNTRIALAKFKQFLQHERGQYDPGLRPTGQARYCEGLPDWVVEPLTRYFHLRQSCWRPARSNARSLNFWSKHTHVWRFLCARYPLTGLRDLKRQHLLDYLDAGLTHGYAASTINSTLLHFHAFLLYLHEQDYPVPPALLRLSLLQQPERLPRFLTDEQVRLLRDDLEQRAAQARFSSARRDALLARAAFYLLWHGGLRLGEVEELRLEDLDLPGKRLLVRHGKGLKDRAVFLTETAISALQAYLAMRGEGSSEHVFLYRHRAVSKDLIYARIRAAGERVGVKVSPHRLRHTCATQLVNAGCRITSIQKLLGHRSLNSTMIYARVHDRTVAEDYYAAMARVEKQVDLAAGTNDTHGSLPVDNDFPRAQLLDLLARLAAPELACEARLSLVERMRCALNGHLTEATIVAA